MMEKQFSRRASNLHVVSRPRKKLRVGSARNPQHKPVDAGAFSLRETGSTVHASRVSQRWRLIAAYEQVFQPITSNELCRFFSGGSPDCKRARISCRKVPSASLQRSFLSTQPIPHVLASAETA